MIRRIPSLLVRNANVALLLIACLLLCGTAWAAPGRPWAWPDDIADKTFGVISGTIYDGFVATRFPKARIMRFSGTSDMVLALKAEKVDAIMVESITSGLVLKSNEALGMLADNVLELPMGVGFSKNDPDLRDRFNRFLKKIRSDGTYDRIHDRWFRGDPDKAVMPDIPVSSGAEKCVLAVSVADLPYVAMMNGRYVGFDVEVVQRFAQSEGIRLEIITLEFDALVAALAAGKADIITDGIAITEERSRRVLFSDPYVHSNSTVLTLKKNLAAGREKGEASAATKEKPASFLRRAVDGFYSNIILENRYLLILDGLKTTAIISVFSSILGSLLGALVCFMRMSPLRLLTIPGRIYISILRGTPVLVVLMLTFYVVFASVNISPVLVAVIAFGLNFAAYVAEIYRTGIEGVDTGQTEAGISLGFTRTGTFTHIVLPQMVRRILPVYKGEFISLVKMTSIVGYIAVQDLTKASDIIRSRTFDAFFPLVMVAVLYFLITWLLLRGLDCLERATDPKIRRGMGRGEGLPGAL